jgi:hypothetical protein
MVLTQEHPLLERVQQLLLVMGHSIKVLMELGL